MNKKLKFEDLVPNNTVGIQKVTPTVANMPNAAQGNVSYSSLIKNDTINTGAPYRVDAFDPKTTYTGGGLLDGGGGGNDGEGGTVTPMSYEEWYNTAKQNAETTRQNAIGDAQVNYNKSKSEYGSRAESLRNMGLTGAGYSDYLNGQAYAQMQGAIANANTQKASTIADIDAKYMDYINQKEEAAKANYANLLSNITYAWTDADIDNYAEAYGLSDPEQIATLKQTRLDRVKRYLDTNDYDIDTLKMLLPEDSAEYNKYFNALATNGMNAVSENMFKGKDKNTATATYNEIKAVLEAQLKATDDPTQKSNLQNALDKLAKEYNNEYNNPITVSPSIKFRFNGVWAHGKTQSGDRFTLKGDDGKYVVEFTGEEVPEGAKNAAKNNNVTDGSVFKYNGNYYVRIGDYYYNFRARDGRGGEWRDFEKEFNGG